MFSQAAKAIQWGWGASDWLFLQMSNWTKTQKLRHKPQTSPCCVQPAPTACAPARRRPRVPPPQCTQRRYRDRPAGARRTHGGHVWVPSPLRLSAWPQDSPGSRFTVRLAPGHLEGTWREPRGQNVLSAESVTRIFGTC